MKDWIIDEWRVCWKFASVWLSSLLAVASELWQYLPYAREYCPPEWVSVAFLLILAARIYKKKEAPDVRSEPTDC